jgi:arginyl-tRNA synthetase
MQGEPPAMIRKSDGAFMYMTSDLATIRYRVQTWNPAKILYVVDERQALHFDQLFWIARRWAYSDVELQHISFGSVLDPKTRKPIKTREGSAVATLTGLLDEAVEEAARRYEQTRRERVERGEDVPELAAEEKRQIAEVVGLGAVKYADLSQNRTSDYVFSWDKMLAMDGNTATYMQYSYARNRSIFRKGGENPEGYRTNAPALTLGKPEERALALQLLRFQEALESAAAEYKPSEITSYLWDLSKAYSVFYQNCRSGAGRGSHVRPGRLLLGDLTARVEKGLDLLGIRTVERM